MRRPKAPLFARYMIKLSVIVPVYNMAGGKKINHCLNSLLAQTLEDMEILAVDDRSTDDTLRVLRAYEAVYPEKIRVIASPENRKQGGAKNLGLAEARGEWIGFVDADDYVNPCFYKVLIGAAEAEGADMAGCDYALTHGYDYSFDRLVHNNAPEQAGELDAEKYRSLILDSGSLVVKVYRRELILGTDSRFPEGIFYEDNALANTWMLRAHRFAYLPYPEELPGDPGAVSPDIPLYYYVQHENSTVHTITKRRLMDRCEAGRCMIEEAKKAGFYEAYKPEIEFSFTQLFYVNTLFSAMPAMREPGKYAFVTDLAREMREAFPDFMENPYYLARIHPEERKLIAMQQRSPLAFYLYYKALWAYRNARKAMGERKRRGAERAKAEMAQSEAKRRDAVAAAGEANGQAEAAARQDAVKTMPKDQVGDPAPTRPGNGLKAAVLGAGSESLHTIRAAKAAGLTVLALDGDEAALGLAEADLSKVVDLRDTEAVLRELRGYEPDFLLTAPVGAILKITGEANSALGLRGISREAAGRCTDKRAFHETLAAAGLRQETALLWTDTDRPVVDGNDGCDGGNVGHGIDGGKGDNSSEGGNSGNGGNCDDGKKTLSYPVIVKPRFGSGSRGIHIAEDAAALTQLAKELPGGEDYVVEPMVPGTEYGVDGAVVGRKFVLTLLRKKHNTPLPHRQATAYLAELSEAKQRAAELFVARIAEALGLSDCLLHCDLILREGADGASPEDYFVIELSARPSGHYLHDTFTPMATGVDPAAAMADYRIALARAQQAADVERAALASFAPKAVRPLSIRYFSAEGTVTKVPAEAEAAALLADLPVKLVAWAPSLRVGEVLPPVSTGHSLMGRGYFILEYVGPEAGSDMAEPGTAGGNTDGGAKACPEALPAMERALNAATERILGSLTAAYK